MATVDKATRETIAMQEQQMVNQSALAKANMKAMDQQGRLELEKSLHEMSAKSTKDAGSKLAGLA